MGATGERLRKVRVSYQGEDCIVLYAEGNKDSRSRPVDVSYVIGWKRRKMEDKCTGSRTAGHGKQEVLTSPKP